MRSVKPTLLAMALWLSCLPVSAEQVMVKYRGVVDLKPFECEWYTRSSLVQRICFDARETYLLVNLNGTYYHYCEVPRSTVAAWRSADSLGRFYNQNVKGRFDCRVSRVPDYKR
jgi:hypothetical protein